MPLPTHELNVQVPIIMSRDLGLGLVVQFDMQCHLTWLSIANIPVHSWQDATSVGDPSGAADGAHLGGSVPSQRHKALWWEGSHNTTQHSQLNAGSSSCAQLMLVYSRES